jgi:hypothetical protein
MLDEIPVLKSSRKSKLLAAEKRMTGNLPSLDSAISFQPFINYLKEKRSFVSGAREQLYNYLVKQFENQPHLLSSIQDPAVLQDQEGLMELLSTSLFPIVDNQEKSNYALAPPYKLSVFYYSEQFRQLFFDPNETELLLPEGVNHAQLKAIQCSLVYDQVLETFYGIKLNEKPELVYPVADPKTGMMRYYRIHYDRRFIQLKLQGELPPIHDCAVCLNTFRILDLEKQLATMPLHLFRAEGFAVWVAEDVTLTESLETIKKILLHGNVSDAAAISGLKRSVKTLVGLDDVEVGLAPFVKINDQYVLDEATGQHGLVMRQWLNDDPESLTQFRMYTGFLREYPAPLAISNLGGEIVEFAPFMEYIYKQDIHSFLNYPIQNSDGLIGVLELASPVKGLLTHDTVDKLEPAIPLLSLALLKCRDNFQVRIDHLIKEKFTALQQSVEWKFAEVAWDHLRKNTTEPLRCQVVFENVYPLYGAIDIRNSSNQRSLAIQKDLKAQLELVQTILNGLQSLLHLPLLEGLAFKNDNFLTSLENALTAEEEICVNEYLHQELEPLFQHLQTNYTLAAPVIENYFTLVKNTNGPLYKNRLDYEESLVQINTTVMHCLEKEQESIQQAYPHYFEKYRTDGIEYNIYIGQSIFPARTFDLFYLRNIRLWQLKCMASATVKTHRLLPSLKIPLLTTQLILVQSQPIAISFRRDERRFDVEGSYNVRYEIIKKRLDKALIRDTGERLTQPGKIALVYSNQKEADEYREYILFLQKKKILKEGLEMLELEELQGIKGLKAMRVEVVLEEEN